MSKFYDQKYRSEELHWGRQPSSIARIFFQNHLPKEGTKLIDIGAGEGRDSIFFAQNGCRVTAFDSSAEGVKKAVARAEKLGVAIDFFKADINEHRLDEYFDVVFSSGVLHYIPPELRKEIITNYKRFTSPGGLHAHTVPIRKPYVPQDPEDDVLEHSWRSGEVLMLYHDWKIELFSEEILDDWFSDYKFAVNRIIAREPTDESTEV